MLLHVQAHWPQMITKEFWPFATWYVINIFVNCYHGQQGTAIPPIEEFTNSIAPLCPQDLHPWGCPIYVLNKHLQDGNHSSSKWDPHSWLGVYVGHSTIHSGNVVLVYNPLTGHTSPQFHVVFDDHFQTVAPHLASSHPAVLDALFDELWTQSQWQYTGDIPPEYLFQETQDLPLSEGDTDTSPPIPLNKQLATAHLEDLIISLMTPGETHEPPVRSPNGETHEPLLMPGETQEPPHHNLTIRTGETHEPPLPLSQNNPTATGETHEAPPLSNHHPLENKSVPYVQQYNSTNEPPK